MFVRPVFGLSEEIQMRMIKKAVEKLGIRHEIYKSPIKADSKDERGELLKNCRGSEVVVVARLNVLGRTGKEVSTTVSRDFMWFVGELKSQCGYILVLDDNLQHTPPNSPITSDDDDWKAVLDRATDVVSNSRGDMTPAKNKKMLDRRWAGTFRGVFDEWTKNPERANEREAMSHIWRDPIYPNAQAAYDALPEDVRSQIKNPQMAGKIFGRRKPGVNIGRPKKS